MLMVAARLKPGATLEQAKNEMETIGARLELSNPAVNRGWRPNLFPIQDELFGNVQKAMWVMLGAVGFLLLMACVNVANLLLARGATRQKEIAIRTALGATRRRLMAQLLCESVLLALAGGALGLALARGQRGAGGAARSGEHPALDAGYRGWAAVSFCAGRRPC